MLEACLELRRGLGKPVEIAGTLSTLALYQLQAGDPVAAAHGEREALQMFRELGDRVGEAIGLEHLGRIALYEGDGATARAELGEALAIAREISYHLVERDSELLLGEVAFAAGDLVEAGSHFAASLVVCRDSGDRRGEANALRWLGKTDLKRGDLHSARAKISEALRTFDEFEMREEMVDCVEDFAEVALREGRSEEATQLAGAADQARSRLAVARPPREERLWQDLLERLREALPRVDFDVAWHEGQRWETKDAVQAALGGHAAAKLAA